MRTQSQSQKCREDLYTSTNQYEVFSDQEQFGYENLEANSRDEIAYFESEESTSDRDYVHPIKKELFFLAENQEFNDVLISEDVQNQFCYNAFQKGQPSLQNNHKDDYCEQNQQCSDESNPSSLKKIKKKISKRKMFNDIPQYNIESKLWPQATKNIYKNLVRALTSFSKSIRQKCAALDEFHLKDGKTGKQKLNQLLKSEQGRNICKFFFGQNKFVIEFLKNNKTDLSTTFRMIPDFISLCD